MPNSQSMPASQAATLDARFRTAVRRLPHAAAAAVSAGVKQAAGTTSVDVDFWWRVFDAQATSRQLDFAARELQSAGSGFYTIASAGHEANALVALSLRPSDPALLHYRSGAFYCARAGQVPGSRPVRDVLAGLMALAEEPIAGGRHKVFGHADLGIIPQTSTIASHLPRAVGLAVAVHRAHRLGVACPWPADAVVVCSFGDASANHSTAAGAINAAVETSHRGLPVPLLLVCEDNGLGISVPTPPDWIRLAYGHRPGLAYLAVDGSNPVAAAAGITEAVRIVRDERRPAFLHLRCVRFLGHAGSDAEVAYRRPADLAADLERDPLLATATVLRSAGVTADTILTRYDAAGAAVDDSVAALTGRPRLSSATQVTAPLAPRHPAAVAQRAAELSAGPRTEPETLAQAVNRALAEALEADRRVLVFGEDVAAKGGVYGVTRGLTRRFGPGRVFDTLLDEQAVLGLGLGSGLAGLIPVPEIQYLAYLHNAADQIRGEAATLPFFSQGRFTNPMVVRVAGLAYQRGFGGHFHNDNALAALRDIPGLVLACPSRADDAAAMLRTCLAAAMVDGTVSVFLEPIALYHRRELDPGDDGWMAADAGGHVPIGRARGYRADTGVGPGRPAALTLVSFGNGVPMSLRVAGRLVAQGIAADVLDLRWLAPLPVQDLLTAASRTGRVLVVDETRHAGGVGEGVLTALVESGFSGAMARVASRDSFIPLGPAAATVLLSEDDVEKAAIALAGRSAG